MKSIARLLAAASLAVIAHPVLAEGAPEPEVTVTPVKGPLYMLQGRGGTMLASVGEDGVLLVDADYAELAPAHADALRELSGAEHAPRFLLNTHWHGDHTGGNALFAKRGSIIVAHENIRKRLSTRQEMKALNRVVEPSPQVALPVVTYGDSLALHFNGDDIEVQHFPRGHTDGDSVIFFARENVVHIGDLIFVDRFPFVDIDSGGNVFGYIDNVDAVLQRVDDATVIVSGHAGLTDKVGLQRFHQMLKSTSAQVKAALDKGMSVEQIVEQGLGEQWQDWGTGFINEAAWISFIAGS